MICHTTNQLMRPHQVVGMSKDKTKCFDYWYKTSLKHLDFLLLVILRSIIYKINSDAFLRPCFPIPKKWHLLAARNSFSIPISIFISSQFQNKKTKNICNLLLCLSILLYAIFFKGLRKIVPNYTVLYFMSSPQKNTT